MKWFTVKSEFVSCDAWDFSGIDSMQYETIQEAIIALEEFKAESPEYVINFLKVRQWEGEDIADPETRLVFNVNVFEEHIDGTYTASTSYEAQKRQSMLVIYPEQINAAGLKTAYAEINKTPQQINESQMLRKAFKKATCYKFGGESWAWIGDGNVYDLRYSRF